MARPRSFEERVPYRPKGEPLVDPQLVPKRTRAGPVTNRTTDAEIPFFFHGREGTAYSRRDTVPQGTNRTDLCCLIPRHILALIQHIMSTSLQAGVGIYWAVNFNFNVHMNKGTMSFLSYFIIPVNVSQDKFNSELIQFYLNFKQITQPRNSMSTLD